MKAYQWQALRVAGIYAVFGVIWIAGSDRLLAVLATDPGTLTQLQTYKGWAFIGVTTLLLYLVLRGQLRSVDQAAAERRQVFERVTDAFVALDKDWRYTYVNEKAAQLFGRRAEDLIGKHIWTEFPEGVGQKFHLAYEKAMAEQTQVFMEEYYPPYDCWFQNLIYPSPEGLTIYFHDITDRKRAEEALRKSEASLAAAQARTKLGSWEWELATMSGTWSAEMFRMFDRDPALGAPSYPEFLELVHPEDRHLIQEWAQRAEDSSTPLIVDFRSNPERGPLRWISTQVEPIRDDAGRVVRLAGTHLDITERKRIEEEVRALNAELEQRVAERTAQLAAVNKELETFTYSVSHDLKAPLRGIEGYSRLLQQEHAGKLDEEGRAFVHTIRQGAAQMGQLIDDLLAYSRMERRSLKTGTVNPRAMAAAAVAERDEDLKAGNVVLRAEVPDTAVSADPDGLAMALRNLLDNALKFTREAARPEIEIGGHETDSSCIIWVRDNGPGFDMKFHDRIFDIFQRLHRAEDYPGTGVGLAIVRKAMERMGGRVWAESKPGEGAAFYLEIPK